MATDDALLRAAARLAGGNDFHAVGDRHEPCEGVHESTEGGEANLDWGLKFQLERDAPNLKKGAKRVCEHVCVVRGAARECEVPSGPPGDGDQTQVKEGEKGSENLDFQD